MPPNVPLPSPLTRPLRFGDAEQIAALKNWLATMEDATVYEKAVEWEVIYTVEKTCRVYAISRDEAEEEAHATNSIDEIISITRIQGEA